MKNILFFLLILTLPVVTTGQQLVVQLDGGITFDGNMLLISEAGEDFTSSVESQAPVYMSVLSDNQLDKKINPNYRWQVFIHKQNISWNDDLNLEVRRTGIGSRLGSSGTPQIQDGDNFLQITNTPVYFFRGRGEIIQIPLSFKMSGYSVTMGAGNFESAIIFTVYDD